MLPGIMPVLAGGKGPTRMVGTIEGTTGTATSSLNVALPSGIQPGERLFILASLQGTVQRDINAISGWDILYRGTPPNSGQLRSVAWFTKIANGSEGASEVMSATSFANMSALAWRVGGRVDNCEVSARNGDIATSLTLPSFSPSANGKLWLGGLHRFGDDPPASVTAGWEAPVKAGIGGTVASYVTSRQIDAASQSLTWSGFASAWPTRGCLVAVW